MRMANARYLGASGGLASSSPRSGRRARAERLLQYRREGALASAGASSLARSGSTRTVMWISIASAMPAAYGGGVSETPYGTRG